MLNDLKIKRLKPREELYRVADHSGLCIEVRPSGSKFWRCRYRFLTKAKMLTIGTYPEISLSYTRDKTRQYRSLLAQNLDPVTEQKKRLIQHWMQYSIRLKVSRMNI
ncbi:Arm DNA-binding domain-containing protein [Acinetobacter genomosp. 16BJ]|nr:Arm DNA-binding domain-containing protein [Acinetobacter higginsii]MCI3878793.1 Arm DNA-binding domain-containing protein [Acinetobacter higginsii]